MSAPPDAAAGSSRRVVVAAALGPVAFAPFGQVIAAGDGVGRSVNLGTADRLDHAARFESTRPEARLNLAVFRAAPQVLPFMVTLLERHPCSTQTFVPLRASRWLVCVAPARPDGAPDPAGLRAFVARGGQGIHFHRGVWHHPIVAFDEPADLVMLAWEDGSPQDCVEFPMAEPVDVVAEPSGT